MRIQCHERPIDGRLLAQGECAVRIGVPLAVGRHGFHRDHISDSQYVGRPADGRSQFLPFEPRPRPPHLGERDDGRRAIRKADRRAFGIQCEHGGRSPPVDADRQSHVPQSRCPVGRDDLGALLRHPSQGPSPAVAAVISQQTGTQHLVGNLLQAWVQRCPDRQAALV